MQRTTLVQASPQPYVFICRFFTPIAAAGCAEKNRQRWPLCPTRTLLLLRANTAKIQDQVRRSIASICFYLALIARRNNRHVGGNGAVGGVQGRNYRLVESVRPHRQITQWSLRHDR